jgi:hypothetical protein
MIFHWLLTTLYLLLFLFILKKSRLLNENLSFQLLAGAFVLKVICGILYGYLDARAGNKGGDSMNYFMDANWMFRAFHEDPIAYFRMLTGIHDGSTEIYRNYYQYLVTWKVNDFDYFFNDSRTIVRLHAFIRLFSFGIYPVHVIVFTFLSFMGQLLLFKTLKAFASGSTLFFILLCFLPSSLIWFSGIMKEPLIMLGLGLLTWNMHCASAKLHAKNLAGILGAIVLLLLVRFTVLLCLVPGTLLFIWLKRETTPWLKAGVTALASIVFLICIDSLAGEYRISRVLHGQLMNSVKTVEYYHPEIKVEHLPLQPDLASVLSLAPVAFMKILATPFKQVLTNPYRIPFVAENLVVFCLVISVVLNFQKPGKAAIPWFLFSLFFIVILYTLIGLTTPFDGTIVRYRSVALPCLLFILFCMHRPKGQSGKNFTS